MVLSLVTRTQNKVSIPLQWTERDEGSMEVNQNISSSKGTKSLSNAVAGNMNQKQSQQRD
jgi:hypothetical protein